jgi:hypothetical protein
MLVEVPRIIEAKVTAGTIKQTGLDNRHRDKNGEVSRKHGSAVSTDIERLPDQHPQLTLPDDDGHLQIGFRT